MTDVVRRLRQRLGALVRRLRRPDGAQSTEDAGRAPSPPSWPLPQLGAGPSGRVLRVARPGVVLARDEVRGHPNRLAGGWERLVIDAGAVVGAGVWAGAFSSGGTATGAALARLAADVGDVEVRWDVAPTDLRAVGVDVDRIVALGRADGPAA